MPFARLDAQKPAEDLPMVPLTAVREHLRRLEGGLRCPSEQLSLEFGWWAGDGPGKS